MRTSNSGYHSATTAAVTERFAKPVSLGWIIRSVSSHFFAVVLVCFGCASNRAALSHKFGRTALHDPRDTKFGTIALGHLDPSRPASIGFQKAKGRKGTVKEAIWDSAELGLSGPGAGIIVAGEMVSAGPYGGDPLGEA